MTTLSSLTPIRYYTSEDPYHYTVDNRPLQDLASNAETLAQSIDQEVNGFRPMNIISAGSSLNIDLSTNPYILKVILTQPTCAITFSNLSVPAGYKRSFEIVFVQGTGSNLINSWPSQITHYSGTPTLSTVVNKGDKFLVESYNEGVSYVATLIQSNIPL